MLPLCPVLLGVGSTALSAWGDATDYRERLRSQGAFPVKSDAGWRFSDNGLGDVVRSYYYRSMRMMFEGSRFDLSHDYLFTNEADYPAAISAIHGKGGAYVGVGHMMSFTYPAWQGASHAFSIDLNARVPFVTLPLYGLMLSMASDRTEFLSLLCGKPIPKSGKWREILASSPFILIEHLKSLPGNSEFASAVDGAVLSTMREAAWYIEGRDIESDATALLARIRNSILNSRSSSHSLFNPVALMMAKDAAGRGGPLTSEEQLNRERDLFIDGRITGVASPIQAHGFDAVMGRIAEAGDPLRVMYLSNLEDWFFDDLDAEDDENPDNAKRGKVASDIAALYTRLGSFQYTDESVLVSAKGCYPTSVYGLKRYIGEAIPFDAPAVNAGRSANLVYRLRREAERARREPIRKRPKLLETYLMKRPVLAEIPAALRRGWKGKPLDADAAHKALMQGSGYYRERLTEWERLAVLKIMQETGLVSKGKND